MVRGTGGKGEGERNKGRRRNKGEQKGKKGAEDGTGVEEGEEGGVEGRRKRREGQIDNIEERGKRWVVINWEENVDLSIYLSI